MVEQLVTRTHALTRAPITPRDVRRRYSNGRVLDVVFRNGYKNKGIWAIEPISKRNEKLAEHTIEK
jgi:hypothetical protein